MTRKFKHAGMQEIYRLFASDTPPTVSDSLQTGYKRGLAGIECRYGRDSLAYAAWAAGRDKRKAAAAP